VGLGGWAQIRIPATDTELPDSEADLSSGRGAQLGQTIIWGTSIVVNETYKTFHEFVTTCFDPVTNELVFDNLLERVRRATAAHARTRCDVSADGANGVLRLGGCRARSRSRRPRRGT